MISVSSGDKTHLLIPVGVKAIILPLNSVIPWISSGGTTLNGIVPCELEVAISPKGLSPFSAVAGEKRKAFSCRLKYLKRVKIKD